MSGIPPIQPNPGFSNYPREMYPPPSGGYSRPPGIHLEAIAGAWQVIQADLGGWVVLTLCVSAIVGIINIPLTLFGNFLAYGNLLGIHEPSLNLGPALESFAISLVAGLITAPVHVGFQWAALK